MTSERLDPLRWIATVGAYRAAGIITAAHGHVLIALGTHGDYDDGGRCRPGKRRLIALTAVSDHTVTAAKRRALELGLLEEAERVRRRGGQLVTYNLTAPVELPPAVAERLGQHDPEDQPDPVPTRCSPGADLVQNPGSPGAPSAPPGALRPSPGALHGEHQTLEPGTGTRETPAPSAGAAGAAGAPDPHELAHRFVERLTALPWDDRQTFAGIVLGPMPAEVHGTCISPAPSLEEIARHLAGLTTLGRADVSESLDRWDAA